MTSSTDSDLAPPNSVGMVDLFLLLTGCAVAAWMTTWISPFIVAFLWFVGGFLSIFNTFSRYDHPANYLLSWNASAFIFRVVAFLVGASFGGSSSLVLVPVTLVVLSPLDFTIDLGFCVQIAVLICLLSAVTASTLLFVGRWMNRGAAVFAVLFSGLG